MKTIIVLGAGGFLASHVERRYAERGWRVVAVGNGAGRSSAHVRHVWRLPHAEFAHLLAVEQPEVVVNAAGRASVPASMVEPYADFESSALLTFRALDDLRRRCPSAAFIQLSSAAVYGDPVSLPIREDTVPSPISPYGWHKRIAEMVLLEHSQLFGMKTASLRIFSAYGAGLRRQVIWDLACKVKASEPGPLPMQGCDDNSRDFIHGSDVAAAVEIIASRGALAGECYNVASGVETPIRDLAKLVMRLGGREPSLQFDNARRAGNPARWHADISSLTQLGFTPAVPLETGAAEVARDAGLCDV